MSEHTGWELRDGGLPRTLTLELTTQNKKGKPHSLLCGTRGLVTVGVADEPRCSHFVRTPFVLLHNPPYKKEALVFPWTLRPLSIRPCCWPRDRRQCCPGAQRMEIGQGGFPSRRAPVSSSLPRPSRSNRDMSVTVVCYVMSDGNRRRC